jgi:hypothetical protein
MACFRYSVPISGLVSGVWAERPESLMPAARHAQRVVQHRDAVEVAGLAEEFAAPVDHGLDVLVAEFGGLGRAPLEGLVRMADEFHIDA